MSDKSVEDRLKRLEKRLYEAEQRSLAVEEVLIALMRELSLTGDDNAIIRRALARAEWFTSRTAGLHDADTNRPDYEPEGAAADAWQRLCVLAGFIPSVLNAAHYQPEEEAEFETYAAKLPTQAEAISAYEQHKAEFGAYLIERGLLVPRDEDETTTPSGPH